MESQGRSREFIRWELFRIIVQRGMPGSLIADAALSRIWPTVGAIVDRLRPRTTGPVGMVQRRWLVLLNAKKTENDLKYHRRS